VDWWVYRMIFDLFLFEVVGDWVVYVSLVEVRVYVY